MKLAQRHTYIQHILEHIYSKNRAHPYRSMRWGILFRTTHPRNLFALTRVSLAISTCRLVRDNRKRANAILNIKHHTLRYYLHGKRTKVNKRTHIYCTFTYIIYIHSMWVYAILMPDLLMQLFRSAVKWEMCCCARKYQTSHDQTRDARLTSIWKGGAQDYTLRVDDTHTSPFRRRDVAAVLVKSAGNGANNELHVYMAFHRMLDARPLAIESTYTHTHTHSITRGISDEQPAT